MKEKIKSIKKNNKEKNDGVILDSCVSAPHPEMARNTDEDEPCDDSRA